MADEIEDWKLTAFALGELEGEEVERLLARSREDTELAKRIEEIRQRGANLSAILSHESAPKLDPARRESIHAPTDASGGAWFHVLGRRVFLGRSLLQRLGVAALLLVALGSAFWAWNDHRLRKLFDEAVACASSDPARARESLSHVLAARSMEEWPCAYLLQAKLDADAGKLTEAEAEYKQLEGVEAGRPGWTRRHAAAARVGLGDVYLRQVVEAGGRRGKGEAYSLGYAQKAFHEAAAIDDPCVEAGIGLTRLKLLEGYDPNRGTIDHDSLQAAEALLKRVDECGLTPTVDGLVSEYVARAVIAWQRSDFWQAEEQLHRASLLHPSSGELLANYTFLYARSLVHMGAMKFNEWMDHKMRAQIEELAGRLEEMYRSDPQRFAVCNEALYSLLNSLGYTLCMGFQESGFLYMDRAKAYRNDIPTVDINEADIYYLWSRSKHFQPQTQLEFANMARELWRQAAEKARQSNQMRKRMICLLNRAVILYSMDPSNVTYQNIMQTELASVSVEFKGDPLLFYEDAVIKARQKDISGATKALQQAIDAEENSQDPPEVKQKTIEQWKKNVEEFGSGGK